MQTISHRTVVYRTRCLPLEAAGRFARCLAANAQYTGVEIAESKRAKGEARWFVSYLPSRGERVEEMVAREQDKRELRALRQEFTFVQDQGFVWCHSHGSGECYEVTAHSCTCADFHYRLKGTGIACKHILALAEARRQDAVRTW